jgi:hypothetical protein
MLIKRHFVPASIPANGPPEITNFQASLASPQVAGTSITFTATTTDPDSDPLEYKFLLDSVAQTAFTSSNSWIWETDSGDVGPHTVGVLVRDNNHNPEGDDSASINFSIEAAPQFEYQAVYPTGYSDETYVKTTNRWFEFEGFRAIDPALSLSGGRYLNSWLTESGYVGSQRFHVEFAAAQVIKRIRYCNSHYDGYETNVGVKDFIVQGSNSATAFANLIYGDDTDWTTIATDVSAMVQHTEAYDGAIWNVIELTNDTAYKYYAIKCVNNHGNASYIGLRRVEFQILVEV